MSPQAKFWQRATFAAGLILVAWNWATNTVRPDHLAADFVPIFQVKFLETKYLYVQLLAFTLFCPLVFGRLPGLDFHQKWGRFFRATWPVAAVFIAWDIWFARIGVWGFSGNYTTGWWPLGLPWEEWAFFVVVPAACVFIFDSLKTLGWTREDGDWEQELTHFLAAFFLVQGFANWQKQYTATTALGCATVLFASFFSGKRDWRGRFYVAYLLSCLFFLLVNGVLTGGFTEHPVVLYNEAEYFGWRVGTIPVDDFGYSFLLLYANCWLFETVGLGEYS